MTDNITITPGTGASVAADQITDGGVADGAYTERVKIGYGTDGSYTDVAAGAGLPVGAAYQEYTGSASANNVDLVAPVDVRPYRWWSLQLTGTFVATVQVQGSNNNSTWVSLFGLQVNSLGASITATFTNASVWAGQVSARYLRVRTTAYTSGTVSCILEVTSETGQLLAPIVTAGQAAGTTGSALAGVGVLGFDGTNYQRVKTDTAGTQIIAAQAGTATLSNVTSSATSVNLLAANTNRKGLVIYNDSSAVLYVKFGTTASTTSFTFYVAAGGHLQLLDLIYTGAIDGIWSAANGAARVTELS